MSNIPWVEKYRPTRLADVEGNVETVKRLRAIANDGNLPNIILSLLYYYYIIGSKLYH